MIFLHSFNPAHWWLFFVCQGSFLTSSKMLLSLLSSRLRRGTTRFNDSRFEKRSPFDTFSEFTEDIIIAGARIRWIGGFGKVFQPYFSIKCYTFLWRCGRALSCSNKISFCNFVWRNFRSLRTIIRRALSFVIEFLLVQLWTENVTQNFYENHCVPKFENCSQLNCKS